MHLFFKNQFKIDIVQKGSSSRNRCRYTSTTFLLFKLFLLSKYTTLKDLASHVVQPQHKFPLEKKASLTKQ